MKANAFIWVANNHNEQILSAVKSIDFFIKNNDIKKNDKIFILTDRKNINFFNSSFNFKKEKIEIIAIDKLFRALNITKRNLNFLSDKPLLFWMFLPFYFDINFNIFEYIFVFDNDTLSKIDPSKYYNDDFPISGKSIFSFSKHENNDLERFESFYQNHYLKSADSNKEQMMRLYENKNSLISFRQTMPIKMMGIKTWEDYSHFYKHKCNGGFWVINIKKYFNFFLKGHKDLINYVYELDNFYNLNKFLDKKYSDEELVFYIFRDNINIINDKNINFYPTNTKILENINSEFVIHFAGFYDKKLWNELLNNDFIDISSELFSSILQNSNKFDKTPWLKRLSYKKNFEKNFIVNEHLNDIFKKPVKRKGVSLVLTIYKPKKSEIKYWTKIYKKWTGEMKIIVDNPDFDISIFIDAGISRQDIFYNKINKGKFSSIIDFLKLDMIRTTHIKICDPDDFIDLKLLSRVESSIMDDWNNDLINFKGCSIKRNKLIFTDRYIHNFLKKNSYRNEKNLANHQIILPVSHYIDFNFDFNSEIRSSDDKLLALISLISGAELRNISKQFYLYRQDNGETNEKNLNIFLENSINSYEEMLNIVKYYGIKPKNFDLISTIKWFLEKVKYNSDPDSITLINQLVLTMIELQKFINSLPHND